MNKTELEKKREKKAEEERLEKEKPQLVVIPVGLSVINNRIYCINLPAPEMISKDSNLAIALSKSNIARNLYIVAAADPEIRYTKVLEKTEHASEKIVYIRLKVGDIVRPFVVPDAQGYSPVIDTIDGVEYTLFEISEIASIIPKEETNIEIVK